jgi:hypothetical protein
MTNLILILVKFFHVCADLFDKIDPEQLTTAYWSIRLIIMVIKFMITILLK